MLSDDEISFVLTTDIRQGPVLRFLLATGLRIGEAYNGHREGQHWVVPSEFSKNKREHRVWLSDLALAQLDRHPGGRPIRCAALASRQFWRLVRARPAADLQHPNNAMGVPPYVVERMLNHIFDGVMAVYNHATYDAERRQALEAWSVWLAGLREKRPADVVPLRPARAPGGMI